MNKVVPLKKSALVIPAQAGIHFSNKDGCLPLQA
jgi:hypothetical protein